MKRNLKPKKNYGSWVFSIKQLLNLGNWPDYIIIGTQKGGTSSLQYYLSQHPKIDTSFIKEIHFFDNNFEQGLHWYKAHFPNSLLLKLKRKITGEASPYYIFHPLVPARIAKVLPKIKMVVLLREPVARAYSHYKMEFRMKRETLSFEEAIKVESERLRRGKNKIMSGQSSLAYKRHSYLERGKYIEQLEKWFQFFSREQFLILKSEDFFSSPQSELSKIFKFLGLPDYKIKNLKSKNVGNYKDSMEKSTRQELSNFFRPYNKRLYNLLGKDFNWEKDYQND
jgi:hypothetical protein